MERSSHVAFCHINEPATAAESEDGKCRQKRNHQQEEPFTLPTTRRQPDSGPAAAPVSLLLHNPISSGHGVHYSLEKHNYFLVLNIYSQSQYQRNHKTKAFSSNGKGFFYKLNTMSNHVATTTSAAFTNNAPQSWRRWVILMLLKTVKKKCNCIITYHCLHI